MIKSPTFKTHLQYIKCINGLLTNLKIDLGVKASKPLEVSRITKYRNLSKVTFDSISTEISLCNQVPEYSQVVAPWLPVKCYYYIYYLECVLLYLLNGNTKVFGHGGHTEVRSALKNSISNNELLFSDKTLSLIELYKDINKHKISPGQNLTHKFHSSNDCCKSLRSKLVSYDLIDFRLKGKIKRMSKADKVTFENKSLTLLDYFYHMRIKANYRDVDFLDFDNEITIQEALEYINEYFLATKSYGIALKVVINSIIKSRGIKI